MQTNAAQLPDDVTALKVLVARRDVEIERQKAEIELLEYQLKLLKRRHFAPSSEVTPVYQRTLFNEAEADGPAGAAVDEADDDVEVEPHKRRRPKRRPLPADLPRERVVHDLAHSEKICPHDGSPLHVIGEETSEQLDIVPARVRVIVHARLKYGCRACAEHVQTASLPPQPIPKSMASAGLLAFIATAKYVDGLPLARIEKIFTRMGIDIGRATLASWMIRLAFLFTPLLNLLRETLESGPAIYMDETRVQVLTGTGKKPTAQTTMWVQVRDGPLDKKGVVLFEYATSKAAEVARRLLSGFKGTVMTDGYEGYDAAIASLSGIRHVADWVHARRYLIDARDAKPEPAKAVTANAALAYIKRLFAIERELETVSPDERARARQERAVPILAEMRAWLDETRPKVPPKSPTGAALAYLDGQWEKLVRYVEDGNVLMHNNLAENAIRPFVVGRKAWLFSATVRGAHASAAIYSLIETAKANGLEPYWYLRHVIAKLPAAKSIEDYEALLPWNVQLPEA